MDIEYFGEHTFIGQFGHFLAILSFVGALSALVAYFLSEKDRTWIGTGRLAFRIHSLAVVGVIVALFWMLVNQYFEYDYVWKHSNSEMPMRYIFSCFWEGQEGSFLLWTFWHVVLGNILIRKAGQWEGPVMAVFALVQVCLASMVLGIHVFGQPIGSSPFLLIRELSDNIGKPWTGIPNYMDVVPVLQDGRGLNPLLQNYWMTIHPPTLFFGFACVLVPFAFAIAGLWRKQYTEWIKPALSWTFLAIGVLGIGILMGGAWAYEALSFGGFWAWDPVENASLVPWLILVGGAHLMLINQRKGTSIFTTFVLVLSAFIFVLYSTYLTRSGVLGDTSVHSFTDNGMTGQLVLYLMLFIALSSAMLITNTGQRRFYWIICGSLVVIGLAFQIFVPAIVLFLLISVVLVFLSYRRDFPKLIEEENISSREFWLFIGSLLLTLSALQITFTTSIPVTNILLSPLKSLFTSLHDLTGTELFKTIASSSVAPPSDVIAHYNQWQLPFAVIICFLIAIGQFLAYGKSGMKRVVRKLSLSLFIALGLTTFFVLWLDYESKDLMWAALLFTASFATTANLAYFVQTLKGKLRNAGPSVAHVGFALVMLGALVSTSGSEEISKNAGLMDMRFLSEDFDNSTDILLYKDDMVRMGDFLVSYKGKEQDGINLRYAVDYFEMTPSRYKKGDIVNIGGADFSCAEDHEASGMFIQDQPKYWRQLQRLHGDTVYPQWQAAEKGKFAFRLHPFVQLNEVFNNVPEPSTKHWFHQDLYTHVRYADMQTSEEGEEDPEWMPPSKVEKNLRDTIILPTAVIILDSLKFAEQSLADSLIGPNSTIGVLKVRVRGLYQSEDAWQTAPLMIFYKGNERVRANYAEFPEQRIKIDLESINPGKSTLTLNIYDREFVVMQAIVFPGINILWIGCILMLIGTIIAVRRRIIFSRK